MKIGIFSFAHMHAESYVRCVAALPDVELLGILRAAPCHALLSIL